MKEVSRRGFITKASVVGAAAAVAGFASLPATADASQKSSPSKAPGAPTTTIKGAVPDDVVLHIRDARKGEVAVIAGYDEVVFTDHRLVSSILKHAASGPKE